jgi:prepilin-type N-terminal cleavage/methylation domain-containing protein
MSRDPRPRRRRAGFTLIEVLAVLFLTALVVGVALDFFIDLSNQSAWASESTRDLRRATSLVDRIARDLERTLLVRKAEEEDPLAHPWIFLAEPRRSENGADHLKFVMRSEPARTKDGPTSDLATVAYSLEPRADGTGYALLRWSSPELPERLDREFPRPDDPASLVLADGVAYFALRFLGEAGEWTDRWDSSQLVESGELPLAVEIEVALLPMAEPRNGALPAEPVLYSRQVLLPVRPLDLEALLDPARGTGAGDQEAEECELTVAECIDWTAVGGVEGMPELQDLLASAPTTCWDPYKPLYGTHPAVRDFCR